MPDLKYRDEAILELANQLRRLMREHGERDFRDGLQVARALEHGNRQGTTAPTRRKPLKTRGYVPV